MSLHNRSSLPVNVSEEPVEITDLLNRDALCKIPWLVDVAASADGDVVGEEL
jgi:hypothetical protein